MDAAPRHPPRAEDPMRSCPSHLYRDQSSQFEVQRDSIPWNRIWKSVGLTKRDLGRLSQILCMTEYDIVPTPSLKTRPLNATSGSFRTILGSIGTAVRVSENTCPI